MTLFYGSNCNLFIINILIKELYQSTNQRINRLYYFVNIADNKNLKIEVYRLKP